MSPSGREELLVLALFQTREQRPRTAKQQCHVSRRAGTHAPCFLSRDLPWCFADCVVRRFQWDSGWQQAAFLIDTTRTQTRATGPRDHPCDSRVCSLAGSVGLKMARSKEPGYVHRQKEFFLSSVCAGRSQEGLCLGRDERGARAAVET